MQRNIVRLAIDPGSRIGKVTTGPREEDVKTAHNCFGQVREQVFGRELPGYCIEAIRGETVNISTDQYALQYGGVPLSNQKPEWLMSPEMDYIVATMLAKLHIPNESEIRCIFTIPIAEEQSPEDYTGQLKRKWKGKFSYKLVGHPEMTVTFAEPKVISQGLSALFAYIYNETGKQVHNLDEGKVMCLDAGARDVNWALFTNMRILSGDCGTLRGENGKRLGYWQVMTDLKDWLASEHGITTSEMVLAQECLKSEPEVFDKGKTVLLSEKYHELLAYYGHAQVVELSKFIPDDVKTLLLCGGTGELFLPAYQQFRSYFQFIGRYASVIGAWRLGFFKNMEW